MCRITARYAAAARNRRPRPVRLAHRYFVQRGRPCRWNRRGVAGLREPRPNIAARRSADPPPRITPRLPGRRIPGRGIGRGFSPAPKGRIWIVDPHRTARHNFLRGRALLLRVGFAYVGKPRGAKSGRWCSRPRARRGGFMARARPTVPGARERRGKKRLRARSRLARAVAKAFHLPRPPTIGIPEPALYGAAPRSSWTAARRMRNMGRRCDCSSRTVCRGPLTTPFIEALAQIHWGRDGRAAAGSKKRAGGFCGRRFPGPQGLRTPRRRCWLACCPTAHRRAADCGWSVEW